MRAATPALEEGRVAAGDPSQGCGKDGVVAPRSQGLPARAARLLLAGYRRFISPALPRACRFEPTCSVYADQAIGRYGLVRGVGLALLRLAKCHPLHPGGFDPVR